MNEKMMTHCKACDEDIAKGVNKCPHCGKDQRNFVMKHKIISGIVILLLISAFGSATGGSKTVTPVSVVKTVAVVTTTKKAIAPVIKTAPVASVTKPVVVNPVPVVKPVVKTWQNVIVFTGASTKNTQKFNVDSDNWRIVWSTTPGTYGAMNFQIYVYGSDGMPNVAANIIGKGNDESYMTTAGEFYLTINTAQNYVITIQEQK